MLVFGMSLARRGVLPTAAIVICLTTALGLALVGAVLAARGPHAPAHDVPLIASAALAWGGGFLLAFAAAAHALRRDRAEGIRDLFVARTTSLRGYVLARVGGLAMLIALVVAGGTLLTGLAAVAAASDAGAVLRMVHATAAGVVFALAFATVIAPIAFAAVGARSRIGGYLFLLSIIMIPELIVLVLGASLPASVADVLSISSALSTLRTSLAPGGVDLARATRAVVALAFVVAFAMLLVLRDASLLFESESEVEA